MDEPTTMPLRPDAEPRSGVQASVPTDIDFDDETMVELGGGPFMMPSPSNVLSPDYPAQDTYGRYEILGRLAVGGMAEVFLAREKAGHGAVRHIAVKRILPQISDDNTFVEMFLDEARLAMRLNHPNICHIYDIGELEDSYFIAMEWVNGVPFGKLIAKARQAGTTLPITVAVKVMAHVADALNYAHQARDGVGRPLNIVHRDCSPQNIMIRFDGVVKLLDFGIAKAATQTTQTEAGIVKGKFSYMSPEQCLGKPLDARSDIFAIGACLYEGLTGNPAFRRATDLDTMRAIVHEPVPSARLVRTEVPPRLDAILRRALAKDPPDRFQTAGELYIALERFLAEEGEFVHAMHLGAAIEKLMPNAAVDGPFAPASSASGRALALPESGSHPTAAPTSKPGPEEPRDPDLDTIDTGQDVAAMIAAGIDEELAAYLQDDLGEDLPDDLHQADPPTDEWTGSDMPPEIRQIQETVADRRATAPRDDAPTKPMGAANAGIPAIFTDSTAVLPGAKSGSTAAKGRRRSTLLRLALVLTVLGVAALVALAVLRAPSEATSAGDDQGSGAEDPAGADEANGAGADEANGAGADEANGAGADEANGAGADEANGAGAGEANDEAAGANGTDNNTEPNEPNETAAATAGAAPGESDPAGEAAATTGSVEVASEPSGATVHLGDLEGTTPVTWDDVAVGAHTLQATLAGHEDTIEEFVVEAGEVAQLTVNLSALPGEGPGAASARPIRRHPARPMGLLVLNTEPPGARVFHGRTPLGRTPLRARLPVGTVRLRLTTPDGSEHVRAVRINPRGQSRAFLPLSH